MKTVVKYLLLACFAFVAAACGGSRGDALRVELPYDDLREGDLVFRRGRNMTSNMIVAKDERAYSHIGVLHQGNDGKWYVIHAVNDEYDFEGDFDRVKMDDIERFFSAERASAGVIVHTFVADGAVSEISARALQYVRDSVRFDSDFVLADEQELYCTELIHVLYGSVGVDVTEGRRTTVGVFGFPDEIIFPSDILNNKKLQIYFAF